VQAQRIYLRSVDAALSHNHLATPASDCAAGYRAKGSSVQDQFGQAEDAGCVDAAGSIWKGLHLDVESLDGYKLYRWKVHVYAFGATPDTNNKWSRQDETAARTCPVWFPTC
jgi:hypothetical protein